MRDHSSRSKGLPDSWRMLKYRFPRTVSTFQIVVVAGFISLIILRNGIGIGNFTFQGYENPDLDRYVGNSKGAKSAVDLDIEPKRNLAQLKNIERIELEGDVENGHDLIEQEGRMEDEDSVEQREEKLEQEDVQDGGGKMEQEDDVENGVNAIERAEQREDNATEEIQEQTIDGENEDETIEQAVRRKDDVMKRPREKEKQSDVTQSDREESMENPDTRIVELEEVDERELTSGESGMEAKEIVDHPEEPKVVNKSEVVKMTEEILQELHRQAVENMTRITSRSDPFILGPKISDWDEQRASWLQKNPHMKSTDPHKPKVLLITGSQPWPCRSPVGDHFLLKMLKNKVDYARIHKTEIFYNFAHLDKPMSHFWAKLPLIRKMMLTHPEMEWIFWMDSDAIFTDMVFEIPFEKYVDYNLVMWGYDSGIYKDRSWVACNTGVFFLRNNQWTLDLLDQWVLMGSAGEIRTEAGKIMTSYLTSRPTMMADDQSALVFLMLTKEDLRPKIHLEWDYWLSGYWAEIVDRYEEFSSSSRPGDGGHRWPFTTHFTGCQPCSGANNPAYGGNTCLDGMERAFNFADNQVMRPLGYEHVSLNSSAVRRIRNETSKPVSSVPNENPWAIDSFY